MGQHEAEELLYNSAVTQAIAFGFRLGHGADNNLRTHAKAAASMIFDPARGEGERDIDLEHAVRSFRLLVDTMIGMRRQAYSNDPNMLQGNIIGELTLTLALSWLCPGFFPFC